VATMLIKDGEKGVGSERLGEMVVVVFWKGIHTVPDGQRCSRGAAAT
jgi:hypothetical protein